MCAYVVRWSGTRRGGGGGGVFIIGRDSGAHANEQTSHLRAAPVYRLGRCAIRVAFSHSMPGGGARSCHLVIMASVTMCSLLVLNLMPHVPVSTACSTLSVAEGYVCLCKILVVILCSKVCTRHLI